MTMNHQTWKNTGLGATVVIVLSLPLSLLLNPTNGPGQRSAATFAGGTTCIECHQKEYRLWKGSDHDRAMAIASDSSVVGNFNNATFTVNGKTSKFYKKEGKFFVFTEGVGGVMQELQVTHTFGIRPLQQYLIPFENGKFQCLPIAWNTAEKKWFHMAGMVYKPEDLQPDNWLYWTNQAQNWNSMCAECHSTNLQKNYDLEKKTYNTTWSDINVNCEACHGPGSLHNDWAKLPEMGRPQDVNAGLTIQTSKITSRKYVEDCARCHARRGSLGDFDYHNSGFLDNANPQLPTTPIYHVDGQFLDEDYEYGSFTQSKMYMKEVRCGDCHDPHSLKRKFEGNALCNQCHRDTEYDTPNHHMHKLKGESGTSFVNKRGERLGPGDGALCRDCHMPHKYYMGVDKRYDHSMRIPRPDLSVKLGTPNACTNCHDDKTDEWALQSVNKWYGERRKPHYGTVLYDALNGKAGADSGLLKMINSNLYPEIIRATAIGYLSAYRSPKAAEAVKRALNDPDPLLRYAAVQNYMAFDSAGLFKALVPLVNDPVKLVRMEAGNRLSTYRKSAFNPIQYEAFVKALDESKKSQEYMADFPSGSYNLGNYYAKLNNLPKAEAFYKAALEIDNLFFPAKTNLAMIYYQQGKTDLAETIYRDIVAKHPETTDGYYYLALLYSEQKKYPEAIGLLEKAVSLPGNNPRLYYNLGLLYQMVGSNEQASATFVRGLQIDPGNFDLLYALFVFHLNQKNMEKARLYIEQLVKWYPNEPQVMEMYRNFSSQR
jgi:tetratricopeptide (TPR) repeat protein